MTHTADRLAERDSLRSRLAALDGTIAAEASFGRDLTDRMREATGRAAIERTEAEAEAAPAEAAPAPAEPGVHPMRVAASARRDHLQARPYASPTSAAPVADWPAVGGPWGGAEGGRSEPPPPSMSDMIRAARRG